MQISIARQLGLQPTTVGNFFMNARRRLHDKWQSDGHGDKGSTEDEDTTAVIMQEPHLMQQQLVETEQLVAEADELVSSHLSGLDEAAAEASEATNNNQAYSLTSL